MKSPRDSEKLYQDTSSEGALDALPSSPVSSVPQSTSDFDYELPEERIAQEPSEKRESSRLLISPVPSLANDPDLVDSRFEKLDEAFSLLRSHSGTDFDSRLEPLVIINDSKVYRARVPVVRPYHSLVPEAGQTKEAKPILSGERPSGVGGEVFVLSFPEKALTRAWQKLEVLLRPQKKFRPGECLWAFTGDGWEPIFCVLEHGPDSCRVENLKPLDEIFHSSGEMPLPPYIRRQTSTSRAGPDPLSGLDTERYQTAYASKIGSAAAPTAGLHFSKELIERLESSGDAKFARVTLHVGLGTFRPVQSEDYQTHDMHEELYSIPKPTLEQILEALRSNRPIIYVGTTSFRAVESFFIECEKQASGRETFQDLERAARAKAGTMCGTKLFVHPALSKDGTGIYAPCLGHAMITNFHQPRSTLLMLVASLCGTERMWSIYKHALQNDYRFLSYGDASLLRFAKPGRLRSRLADSSLEGSD